MIPNSIEDAKTSGEAAAIWWMNKLRTPKHDSVDKNDVVAYANLLATIAATHVDETNLSRFGNLMKDMIDSEIEKNHTVITFEIDCCLGTNLKTLANEAGLKAAWPMNTSMRIIGEGEVCVRCGRDAKEETIWRR